MYYEEEINLVGIISEQDLNDSTTASELSRILFDALALGPIYEPLLNDLKSKKMICEKTRDIKQSDVVKCLYSNSFL